MRLSKARVRATVADLPSELLQEITIHLERQDLPIFRLVCSSWSFAAAPELFSQLLIHILSDNLDSTVQLLQTLAQKNNRISHYVRRIYIYNVSATSHRYRGNACESETAQDARLSIESCIQGALSSLVCLQSVTWSILDEWKRKWSSGPVSVSGAREPDVTGIYRAILNGLSSLEILSNFALIIDPNWSISDPRLSMSILSSLPFNSLQGLSSISLEVPYPILKLIRPTIHGMMTRNQLKSLSLQTSCTPYLSWLLTPTEESASEELTEYINYIMSPLKLEFLYMSAWSVAPAIGLLKSLSTLHVFGCTNIDMWTTLRTGNVRIRDLKTDRISQELIWYIASYQGLEKLAFPDFKYVPDIWRGGDFCDSLVNHSETLQELSILPDWDTVWGFGQGNVAAMSECVNLRRLEVMAKLRRDSIDMDLGALLSMVLSSAFLRDLIIRLPHGLGYDEHLKTVEGFILSFGPLPAGTPPMLFPKITLGLGDRVFYVAETSTSDWTGLGFKLVNTDSFQPLLETQVTSTETRRHSRVNLLGFFRKVRAKFHCPIK
ncbi:hypothetical protein C8J56DRAFT_329780 [Mycena floridula]|nr:hypothetical protein C8J56DRAFT_329780 [Mycena floridula]